MNVRNLFNTALQNRQLMRCAGWGSRQELKTEGSHQVAPNMVEPWTEIGKSVKSSCRRKAIYGLNRFRLMWRVYLNGSMQIAAENGNLKIAEADEGRNMLINELKSNKISWTTITQGEHMQKRTDRTLWWARSWRTKGSSRSRRQNLGSDIIGTKGREWQWASATTFSREVPSTAAANWLTGRPLMKSNIQ